mmetsp:Transcript_23200/g.48591  ORF Transcript_23200/g.48591 Transcript_23200/m.48591 type:complete len:209 (-) Transcript_23200:245-871(-)
MDVVRGARVGGVGGGARRLEVQAGRARRLLPRQLLDVRRSGHGGERMLCAGRGPHEPAGAGGRAGVAAVAAGGAGLRGVPLRQHQGLRPRGRRPLRRRRAAAHERRGVLRHEPRPAHHVAAPRGGGGVGLRLRAAVQAQGRHRRRRLLPAARRLLRPDAALRARERRDVPRQPRHRGGPRRPLRRARGAGAGLRLPAHAPRRPVRLLG